MTENEDRTLSELAMADGDAGQAPLRFNPGIPSGDLSVILTRMAAKGWVDKAFRGGEWNGPKPYMARGSCIYRITPKGRQALANHRLTKP